MPPRKGGTPVWQNASHLWAGFALNRPRQAVRNRLLQAHRPPQPPFPLHRRLPLLHRRLPLLHRRLPLPRPSLLLLLALVENRSTPEYALPVTVQESLEPLY
jgi:hypothetical protein